MTCSMLLVTKIKYSKSLDSQRTDGDIKNSFNFAVNICKYVFKNGIKSSIHPSFITTKHRRVTKNYSFWVFGILCHFYFGPILAPILILITYAVQTHTQFNVIGKQSYANDCSS